jgi:hypothetical protein
MRATRRFIPSSIPCLEGRVVLSQMAPHAGSLAAELRPIRLPSAEIAQSNASEQSFPNSVSDTIHTGQPVAEQVTIKYSDGSTQTESVRKVPDPANNTVTTYKTINLRNNGGTESVVDTESFSGSTTPFSGVDNTHTITTTLPNGSIQTQTIHEVITGDKTIQNGTINEPGGGIETWTSVGVKRGPTTSTNKTITEPNGTVEQQKTVTTHYGQLDSTATGTTRIPSKDTIEYTSSATDVIRVQPPA